MLTGARWRLSCSPSAQPPSPSSPSCPKMTENRLFLVIYIWSYISCHTFLVIHGHIFLVIHFLSYFLFYISCHTFLVIYFWSYIFYVIYLLSYISCHTFLVTYFWSYIIFGFARTSKIFLMLIRSVLSSILYLPSPSWSSLGVMTVSPRWEQ